MGIRGSRDPAFRRTDMPSCAWVSAFLLLPHRVFPPRPAEVPAGPQERRGEADADHGVPRRLFHDIRLEPLGLDIVVRPQRIDLEAPPAEAAPPQGSLLARAVVQAVAPDAGQ